MLKYAVRICNTDGHRYSSYLFAVVKEEHVTKYRNLAYEFINKNEELSSSWTAVSIWNPSIIWGDNK